MIKPILILTFGIACAAQSIKFNPVERAVVENVMANAPQKNDLRREAVRKHFEDLGCTTVDLKVRGAKLPNLECVLPGETIEQIIVGAHFDKTEGSRGVVDNWTGAAMLPLLYQSLKTDKHKYTFRFLAFTDEEKGLVGSTYYASKMSKSDLESTLAMINLDSLGMAETKIWISRADKTLVELMIKLGNAMKLNVEGVNVDQIGSTDQEPFRKRQIRTLTFHSLTQDNYSVLHSSKDNENALDLGKYYDSYRLVSAYLAYLDIALASSGHFN